MRSPIGVARMSCDAAYEMRLQVRQAGEVSKAELQLASTSTRLQTMYADQDNEQSVMWQEKARALTRIRVIV